MIDIKDKHDCCGCTACMNICPKKAITMVEDNEGFKYPRIDKEKCINCGLCKKTCPIINKIENEDLKSEYPYAYITRTKTMSVLMKTSSGGFISTLAKYVIANKGIVYSVVLSDKQEVTHTKIETLEELEKSYGSKYVQSNLENTFYECKKSLESNRLTLFVGNPCQIEGLMHYLKKDYNNLITADFVCHGVASPKVWKDYINFIEEKYKSRIKSVNFRNKDLGYRSTQMKIELENGKIISESPRINVFLKLFYSNMISRPSCANCSFKKLKHISNFTSYDCWNPTDICSDIKDDNKGYTSLFVNNSRGEEILHEIEPMLDIYEINRERIIPKPTGGMLLNSAKPNKDCDSFWDYYTKNQFSNTKNKYCKIRIMDKIAEKSKVFFAKIGLINYISSIRKKRKKRR